MRRSGETDLKKLTQTRGLDSFLSGHLARSDLKELEGYQLAWHLVPRSLPPVALSLKSRTEARSLETDQHAGPETPPYEWNAEEGGGERADEIAVVLSVKRTIADDVRSFLAGSRPVELVLHSSDAMLSADQMKPGG